MSTIRQPDLHMSCAERIGRSSRQESNALQTRAIAISTDPVALDYYVGKYILFPTGGTYGENGSHAEEPDSNDPGLPGGYYNSTLEFCRDPLADHSIINGTLDEQEMAVHLFEHAPGDLDSDGDIDMDDFQHMQTCHEGADEPCRYECQAADLDGDGDVDMDDATAFFDGLNGPDQPPAGPAD